MLKRVVGGLAPVAVAFACSSGPAQGTDSGANDASADSSQQETSSPDSSPNDVVTNDAPAFSPSQLSGLAVWLRADKGVATDNLGVTAWADQSVNHNDFVDSTTRCSAASSGINGLPIVDCTAGGQVTGHATSIGTGPFTIEIVADHIPDNSGIFATTQTNTFDLLTSSTKIVGNVVLGLNVQAAAQGAKVVTGGAAHILGFVRDASGNIALRTDGAADGASVANGAVDFGTFPNSSLGNARVAELVLVAGTLTSQQTSDLEAYLKARYGL